MKFNRFSWENYLQTARGKAAINDFSLLEEEPSEIKVSFKYNPQLESRLGGAKQKEAIATILDDYWNYVIGNRVQPQTADEAKTLYEDVISNGLVIDGETIIEKGDYQFSLGIVTWLSWLLYQLSPDFFVPYIFPYRAFYLYQEADAFDMELPPVPKKPDYKARCMYYWELCGLFNDFRRKNALSPAELCAFLYDYAPNFSAKQEMDMPQPEQAWFIGGKITDADCADDSLVFWQGNEETKKGDILVHYETYPISAITHIWRAATDGQIDPFFRFYGNVYLTDRIETPHITLGELKQDAHFANHPLVKKNFQGVNGWAMSGDDYSRLCSMLAAKGMDVSGLPKLFAINTNADDRIKRESDVEEYLLEPMLNSMGFKKDSDYIRRLPVKAGRGHRIVPDYALHYSDKHDEESAKVIIEAKFHMKNPQEVDDAFKQARSYARLLGATTIVLCDKDSLLVYEQGENFDRHHYTKYYWSEMNNPDKFTSLKNKMQK